MKPRVLMIGLLLFLISAMVWAGAAEEQSDGSIVIPEDIEWVTADRIGNPNAEITLTYAVEISYSHIVDNPERREYLTTRLEEWAKAHPNVKLLPQIQPSNEATKLAKQLQQGASTSLPDMLQIDGQFVPYFYQWLQPIDEFVSEEELDDWFPWTKETMIDPNDGKLKSLWFLTASVGMWYRNDLIPEPPKTWDELIATSKKLQADGFEYGFAGRGSLSEQIPFGRVLPMFYAQGGTLVDSDGMPNFGEGENREIMASVLQFWQDAVVKDKVAPIRIIDIKSSADIVAEAAKDGNMPMFFAGSWVLGTIKNLMGEEEAKKWSFTYIPTKDGNPMSVPGGHNLGFFTKDKEKLELLVDLAKYLYAGEEGMAGWCAAAGYTPVRKSVSEGYPAFTDDPWQKAFAASIAVGKTRPGIPSYAVISEYLQVAWQNVVLGIESPGEAVDNAFTKTINQVVR